MATPVFQQVTPNIYRLEFVWKLPFFKLPVAVFLVRADDGWSLVDAGPPGVETSLAEQILKQTGGGRPVRLILTHGHVDHAGTADWLYRQWQLPVAAGRDETPYLIGPEHYN